MSKSQSGPQRRANPTQKVIKRVAEAEGVSPEELTPPLFEVIDPDALDQLFGNTATAGRMEGQVIFTYSGYEITVSGDGYVSVRKQGVNGDGSDVSQL